MINLVDLVASYLRNPQDTDVIPKDKMAMPFCLLETLTGFDF